MNTAQAIRAKRKALVLAAEDAMKVATEAVRRGEYKLPQKTQLNRLIGICNEATCAEEIANYIRYQTGRKSGGNAPWGREFADLVIAKIAPPLADLAASLSGAGEAEVDRAKVAAWHLYSVFLTRAYTYWQEVDRANRKPDKRGKSHGRASR